MDSPIPAWKDQFTTSLTRDCKYSLLFLVVNDFTALPSPFESLSSLIYFLKPRSCLSTLLASFLLLRNTAFHFVPEPRDLQDQP